MFTLDTSQITNPKSLEFANKRFTTFIDAWRKKVRLNKNSANSSKDDNIQANKRPLTSYDKLALAFMYIIGGVSEQRLEDLCTDYKTFDSIPIGDLEKISKVIEPNKLNVKVSKQVIEETVLCTLLKNNKMKDLLMYQKFKPFLGKKVIGTFVGKGIRGNKVEIRFNFDASDYTLLAMSFKNMSSLIDECLTQILGGIGTKTANDKSKKKSLDIEELDALSKRLKEISKDRSKMSVGVNDLFQDYSVNGYRVWNSLARGDIRFSEKARNLITKSPTDEIDSFLLNLCYLDDMNAALKSGLVELRPSSKNSDNKDIYLYRGVDIPGACKWFKITSLNTNSRNMNVVKKALANEIIKKIGGSGFIVSDAAPMSTSCSKGTAAKFSRSYSNPGPGTALVALIKAPGNKFKGVDISEISVYSFEQEILLPAGVQLKVTRCEYDESDDSPIEVYAEVVSDWSDLNDM